MIIFIDESGDPGFKTKRGSSKYFVLSCLIFNDEKEIIEMNETIIQYRRAHKIPDKYEFKFNKLNKEDRCSFLRYVKNNKFTIAILVADKETVLSKSACALRDLNYEYFLGLLLERVITTNGSYDLRIDGSMTKILKYIFKSRIRKYSRHQIKLNLHVLNSKNDLLIQLADMIAGCVAKKLGNSNDRYVYIDILRNHVIEEIIV